MKPEQAKSFIIGLRAIETEHPKYLMKYGELRYCVFIFRHDASKTIDIMPMNEIEKDAALWKSIHKLFLQVVSKGNSSFFKQTI